VRRALRRAGAPVAERGAGIAAVVRAGRLLGAGRRPGRVAGAVADGAARLCPGAVSTLRLADGEGGALRLVAASGPSFLRRHADVLDDDLALDVLADARPLLVRDVRLEPRSRRRALWRERGYAAWYGLPLPGAGGPAGVLGLALPAGAGTPGIQERRVLQMYAAQAALALRAASLADTADRQRAALEVARTELLEAAKLLALGHLVSDVVHEASNVLGTITLRMETLLEGPRDAETGPQLHALQAHCRQIGDLIGELRRFSGAGSRPASAVDVGACLQRLLDLREPRMRLRGVKLRRGLAGGLPAVVADRAHLERALLALVLEAETALAGGGTITVTTAARRDDGRSWVSVTIEDDGPAIAPELLPRLFDPFAPRVKGRGPSIGLAAAHAIIGAQGGRLTVAGRHGRGAEFRVELPGVDGTVAAALAGG